MERLWAQSYHIWIIFTPLAVWRRPQRLSRPPFVQASPIKQVLQRCTNTQIGWNASLHTEKQNHLSLNRTNWNGLKQCSAHPGCHHLSVLLPGGVLVFFFPFHFSELQIWKYWWKLHLFKCLMSLLFTSFFYLDRNTHQNNVLYPSLRQHTGLLWKVRNLSNYKNVYV